jgi:hypothetical protein
MFLRNFLIRLKYQLVTLELINRAQRPISFSETYFKGLKAKMFLRSIRPKRIKRILQFLFRIKKILKKTFKKTLKKALKKALKKHLQKKKNYSH